MSSTPVHGSPAGYEAGCRTRVACPHQSSASMLTCAEASVRRRADYQAAALPPDQPLLRHPLAAPAVVDAPEPASGRPPKHGTPWGYQRGCRVRTECPHWRAGRLTCADARRAYFEEYKRRRRADDAGGLVHGTTAGYSSGCHDASRCPRGEDRRSCADAWRAYKRRKAREAGVRPVRTADPHLAREAVLALRARGHSIREISAMSGVGRTTLGEMLRAGSRQEARRFTEDVIQRVIAATETEPGRVSRTLQDAEGRRT
jgi:hypothetical protein